MAYNLINISFWHCLLNNSNFSDHFQKIYTAVTTVLLGIQDLNVRLKKVEKQNNLHKLKTLALDISNMQRSLSLKTINEVLAFENSLSQNADEYNKFVSLIRDLVI